MLLPWLRSMDPIQLQRLEELDDLAMSYETAVQMLPERNYLNTFLDFYRIKHRDLRLIDAAEPFREALRELCGDSVWQPIAECAESLFGIPKRITRFEDDSTLREELEGPRGGAPFFFVFDLMFCEYEGFTLCFLSGTNH